MTSDPTKIVVTQNSCGSCGTDTMEVHHQSFPEMRVAGASPEQAAERLVSQLESSLDAVCDPCHRDPVQQAIADARAFLHKEKAADAP